MGRKAKRFGAKRFGGCLLLHRIYLLLRAYPKPSLESLGTPPKHYSPPPPSKLIIGGDRGAQTLLRLAFVSHIIAVTSGGELQCRVSSHHGVLTIKLRLNPIKNTI